MATKFTQIVGQPFSKPVRAEFERRRSLDQNYDTVSELYQPYFKIRRLKSLRPVTAMQKPNEGDFMTGRFSSLGKVRDEDYDITYGMNDLEEDSEMRGYPAITSVTFELEDFTFYRATINFEIPDITYFREFREKWLQFGAPIEMEWGRYSPVEFEENANEDMLPNLEKRMGNVVKFDYGMDGGGKEITGTLTVYSVTWLPVLQEGTSEEHETDEFRNMMKYLHRSIFNNPIELLGDAMEVENNRNLLTGYFSVQNMLTGYTDTTLRETTDKMTTLSVKDRVKEILKDSVWGVVKRDRESIPVTSIRGADTAFWIEVMGSGVSKEVEGNEQFDNIYDESIFKIIGSNYDNVKTIEEFINCHFKLDPKEYATDMYHFISFAMVEKILNRLMMGQKKKKGEGVYDGEIFHFDLSNSVINDIAFKGIRSKMPDSIIINPRNNKYRLQDDGNFVKDNKNGNLFLSKDIFISASDFYRLIDQSKNAYSFVSELLSHVKTATADIIDLEQKRENGIIEQGNIIINGIGLVDSSTITDNGNDNYVTFKLHHPREKLQNVSLNTEISDDISNMIFFRSQEFNSNSTVDVNEINLFSKPLNNRHFIDAIYNSSYGDDIKEIEKVVKEGRDGVQKREPNKTNFYPLKQEKVFKKFRTAEQDLGISLDIDDYGNVVLKSKHNQTVVAESYDLRREFLKKIERNFSSVSSSVQRRIVENVDDDALTEKIGKDYIHNLLAFIYLYFAQSVELQKTNYYRNNNFRMPYTISFEVDGIAGIIPSQAFKVDLENFPVEYGDQESALFVVTGLSHTFEGNSWVTTINGSFWLDFRKSTFLNKYDKDGIGDVMTKEYTNTIKALRFIFKRKILQDLDKEKESLTFIRDFEFGDFDDSEDFPLDDFIL